MIYFKRVVTSDVAFGFIFFNPFTSASIFFSSPCVNNLNVTVLPDLGKVNVKLLPLAYNDVSIFFSSNLDRSTVASVSCP